MIILIYLIMSCCLNCYFSKKYGRKKLFWGVFGFLCPFFSTIILMLLGNKNRINIENDNSNNKLNYNTTLKYSNSDVNCEHSRVNNIQNREYLKIIGKRNPLFIDVETTGLHSNDSIVSLCMILLDCAKTETTNKLTYKKIHYIFDPCKKSHPIAEKIHGYDDWVLRHQNLFIEKIEIIQKLLEECDLIVAHNVKFDISFIRREFHKYGIHFPNIDTVCTMEETVGASSLNACAHEIGLQRDSECHDAGEDAKLVMCIYLSRRSNISVGEIFYKLQIPIENFISPPQRPDGPLPRRNNIKKKNDIMERISQMQPSEES